jgi:hypothetical protein
MLFKGRTIGERKSKLLTIIQKELINMQKEGVNAAVACKLLKIDLNKITTRYNTKELSGIISTLKGFSRG